MTWCSSDGKDMQVKQTANIQVYPSKIIMRLWPNNDLVYIHLNDKRVMFLVSDSMALRNLLGQQPSSLPSYIIICWLYVAILAATIHDREDFEKTNLETERCVKIWLHWFRQQCLHHPLKCQPGIDSAIYLCRTHRWCHSLSLFQAEFCA